MGYFCSLPGAEMTITSEQVAENVRRAREHTPIGEGTKRALLTQTRTITEPASRETLQLRLQARLADKAIRLRRGADGWPWSVSDSWLQQEIEVLETALKAEP